jgi:two-component system, LuxR family, sensor kinase FixL
MKNAGDLSQAVFDSEEKLRAIMETAVEGIITIDERGIIESMNPAAERMFGYKAEELIGKNVKELMPSPYREEHDGYLQNYLRTGKAKIIGIGREVVALRRDGTVFPIDLAVNEVRLANGRRLFTGFVRDISERKELEQSLLEVSDREQRRIGHDLHDGLGQHLAGIELMSEVLEQNLASKKLKGEAGRAGDIARHVREAISQTRALARGLSPVISEPEGLMSALRELAANSENMFRVRCHFQCPAPVLIADHTVATHLYRIAQEAVSNAIKHGRARQVDIDLEGAADRVLLTIKDDGSGFDGKPSAGRGMGLRIMQYRAAIMGGTLTIVGEPGRGARLTCLVPKKHSVGS